jgi:hypothetical protein
MMNINNIFSGVRIIESLSMVKSGTPYEIRRSWKERLLTRPWRPHAATRWVTPIVPSTEAMQLPNGDLVMHPEMAAKLRQLPL